jgi:hypothetical protein
MAAYEGRMLILLETALDEIRLESEDMMVSSIKFGFSP